MENDDFQAKKAHTHRKNKTEGAADIIEVEKKRLEVLKRRQERELSQVGDPKNSSAMKF